MLLAWHGDLLARNILKKNGVVAHNLSMRTRTCFHAFAVLKITEQMNITQATRPSPMSDSQRKHEHIPVWAIASAVTLVAGSGLWWLFRRPCKYLTNEDLPPTVSDSIEVVRELNEDERLAIKTPFLDGDDMRWLAAGKDYKNKVDEEQLRSVTFSLGDYFLSFVHRYGHILVCRDKYGIFLGGVGMIPPYKSHTFFNLHFYRSVIPLGMPPAMRTDKNIAARFRGFSQVQAVHKELMKDIPHWYVQVVSVLPNAQGKGVGRKLVEAAIAIAGDTPMFLECHDNNVAFYEKFGFTVGKRYDVVPKGSDDTTPFPMNSMVRCV